nr:Uncharacterised protein [Pseudomonas putida]
MARSLPIALFLLLLSAWLAASYGVRYGLMEDARWVGLCSAAQGYWQCQARSLLGLGIHHQVLAWGALGISLLAQWVPGRGGWGWRCWGCCSGFLLWCCIPRALQYSRWCWRGCGWFGSLRTRPGILFVGKPAPVRITAGVAGAGLP